ncbi:hypothetical protein RUM43_008562 [Polyplax serrata]|uniref:Uncharacterized protein n=1 Tax=Polyplax serrata TaxID=468196 RepID=A0AAN8P5Z9_POLSC
MLLSLNGTEEEEKAGEAAAAAPAPAASSQESKLTRKRKEQSVNSSVEIDTFWNIKNFAHPSAAVNSRQLESFQISQRLQI